MDAAVAVHDYDNVAATDVQLLPHDYVEPRETNSQRRRIGRIAFTEQLPDGAAKDLYIHWDGDDDFTICKESDAMSRLSLVFPAVRVGSASFGLGVFARKRIRCNELILRETPLLTACTDSEAEMNFYELSLPMQAAVLSLNDPEQTGSVSNAHLSIPSELQPNGEKSVASIFRHNSIPNGFGPLVDFSSLYSVTCRLNHSCAPNVRWKWDPVAREQNVFAVRDINVGEELFASYIDEFAPIEQRREKLLTNFYFVCSCALCSGKASEEMLRVHQIGCRVAECIRQGKNLIGGSQGVDGGDGAGRHHQTRSSVNTKGRDSRRRPPVAPTTAAAAVEEGMALCRSLPQFDGQRESLREIKRHLAQLLR